MEGNTFTIKKKYAFIGLLVVALVFGYSLNFLLAGRSNIPQQTSGNSPQPASGMANDNSMASHHTPAQAKPSGFFDSAVGKQAPDFELQDIDGNSVKLSDYRGKNVVLFFNEGSMCYPACWNQMSALSKDERFSSDDVVALSIVVDSQAQWKQIMQKAPQMSNIKILFDTNKKASIDYDVLYADSSMHKGSYPGHTYFVIDKNGIVRYTLDDSRMAINNDKIASELDNIKGA